MILLGWIIFLLIPPSLQLIWPLHTHRPYSTLVTDHKDKPLHAYLASDDKWRLPTYPNDLPPSLEKVLIFKEDRYFFYHPGVNPVAIFRAMFQNIARGKRVSGASTITMQTVRLLEPRPRNIASKFIEIFRSWQLEFLLTKREILSLYLNLLPYGGNIEGVSSAALLYLGKQPHQLSLAELAALTVIPNNPELIQNRNELLKWRNRWLNRWLEAGLFDEENIRNALNEPMIPQRKLAPVLAPHLSNKLKSQYPGSHIQTFIEPNLQAECEKLVKDYMQNLSAYGIHNAAVMVMRNKDARVVAYLGSADFNDRRDGGQVNGARAIRQPGSALKPALYALGIDKGMFCPQTVLNDVPMNFNGYQPENYDDKFRGSVTLHYALSNSLNIPAVKALSEIGVGTFSAVLFNAGFRQMGKKGKKLGLSMILGGCGVSLEEMAGLYVAQANKGLYRPLKYSRFDTMSSTRRLYSGAAAFMVHEILSGIARPDLPVGYENSTHLPAVAWKTGTSYGRRDAWSIGYNSTYTIAVWIGNFNNRGVPELSGATIATPLLFNLFNTLDYNGQPHFFAMPPSCSIRKVCSESGKIPAEFCTETRTDFFIPMVSPGEKCDHLRKWTVSEDGSCSYCRNCQPETGYKTVWLPNINPELMAWSMQQNLALPEFPPHFEGCDRWLMEGGPEISFPRHDSEILVDIANPEPILLQARTEQDVKEIFWYVDHEFVGKSPRNKGLFVTLPEGDQTIHCTDDKGRSSSVKIKVTYVNL